MTSSTPSPPAAPVPPAAAPATGIAVALGRIPSGLFVVTWRDGDTDRGMLASWVMQAGFEPPALSVAIAPARDLLAAVDRGATFVVNVLAESQRSLLARFGRPADDPFVGLTIERAPGGVAVLADAAAWLECRSAVRAAHGDHVVVIAEVVAAGGTGAEPLVHLRKSGLRY